jgi:hypothetical protein
MGCFSFMCNVSGKPGLSSSFNGSPVYLFLLKDGKVIEEMYGNYDSYGRVFKNEIRGDVPHELYDSFEWKMDWNKVCDLMFSDNSGDGIALILAEHYNGVHPTVRSDDDPNQGWGGDDEEECLMASTTTERWKRVENPYHKVY